MWAKAMRNVPHAGQDTNNAIEAYHGSLKLRLSLQKRTLKGRRVDWFVYVLTIDAAAYYQV